MWRRLVLARQLLAPFAILLVSAIAVGWYAWSWIPVQQQYFANRNLRSLSSLGESLAATINNLDHVLDNAAASGLAARALPDYFKSQVPNVLVAGANERASHNDLTALASDPPAIWVEPDEGTFYVWFSYQSANDSFKEPVVIKLEVARLIQPSRIPHDFDAFFIARTDGVVIFQTPRESSRAHLVSVTDLTKGGAPLNIASLQEIGVSDVTLGGAPYKLFAHSMRLSYPVLVRPSQQEAAKSNTRPSLRYGADSDVWVLCGLVSKPHFDGAARGITDSTTPLLWFILSALLLSSIGPFITWAMAKPSTRFRSRDLITQYLSLFILTGIITFGGLDLYFYGYELDCQLRDRLTHFAAQIGVHVYDEDDHIWAQLTLFDEILNKTLPKEALNVDRGKRPRLPADYWSAAADRVDSTCTPDWACRVNILDETKRNLT